MTALKIIFMGTPEFATPCLQAVIDSPHEIVAVVSQPDRPVGRGRKMTPPPIAALASKNQLKLFQWEKLNQESYDALSALECDLAIVVAYGKILPQRYLDLPRLGCLNVHSSLLPAWRGAAPIQWAVINGDRETGVSIMRLDAGMDTGDVALQQRTEIGADETAGELHDRLALIGAEALSNVIEQLVDGRAEFTQQEHERATHARRLAKSDGLVDWHLPALAVHNHIRGMSPWPGAYVTTPAGPLKIHGSRPITGQGQPGHIIAIESDGPVIACESGGVVLTVLQRPGKKRVRGDEYVRAYELNVGQPLVQES